MLGHRFWSSLSDKHEVFATIRGTKDSLPAIPNINIENVLENVDISNIEDLQKKLQQVKPEMVINCVGIIKQIKESSDNIISIETNSLFPHKLAKMCKDIGSRMIQFSTDCVFDGRDGNYNEKSIANALDLYGRTKFLGEVSKEQHVLTLRTSIIGREVVPKGSLIDWFLSQEGKLINGFKNAIYSGFPTKTVVDIIDEYILPNPSLSGIYHLSSDPINKYDLLSLTKDLFNKNITMKEDYDFKIDRSLDSTRFQKATGFTPKPWEELIKDIDIDREFYDSLKS